VGRASTHHEQTIDKRRSRVHTALVGALGAGQTVQDVGARPTVGQARGAAA
jgi:hypothetical protein